MSKTVALRNIRVRFAGATDIGRKRTLNEDSLLLPDGLPLLLVADGMGGHASGEVASRLAVETVADYFHKTADEAELTWPFKIDRADAFEANRLVVAIKLANQKIWETSQQGGAGEAGAQAGMGTTIVAALFLADRVLVAHVGDSRVYRLRGRRLVQVTDDHSLMNDYMRMKRLRPDEMGGFAHKNVIVRALGMKEQVQVDVTRDVPHVGDTYLLCSDGLSGMVPDDELQAILLDEPDLDRAAARLIAAANGAGGADNITAALARVEAE